MYSPNEVKEREIDRGIGLGPDRYDNVLFRDDGSLFRPAV